MAMSGDASTVMKAFFPVREAIQSNAESRASASNDAATHPDRVKQTSSDSAHAFCERTFFLESVIAEFIFAVIILGNALFSGMEVEAGADPPESFRSMQNGPTLLFRV